MVDAIPTPDPRESGADRLYDRSVKSFQEGGHPDWIELRDYARSLEATIATQQAEVERVRLAGKDAALALDHAVAILDRLGISAEKVFEIARDNMLFALTPSPKDASDATI